MAGAGDALYTNSMDVASADATGAAHTTPVADARRTRIASYDAAMQFFPTRRRREEI